MARMTREDGVEDEAEPRKRAIPGGAWDRAEHHTSQQSGHLDFDCLIADINRDAISASLA